MPGGSPEPIERVLASSREPLSLDRLVAWNLARPAELWRFLGEAAAAGQVEEPEPGTFRWVDEARRAEVLRATTAADWAALLERDELIPVVLDAAHAAAAGGLYLAAGEAFRALVNLERRDAFPGGERGWLATVIECIRLYRQMYGIRRALLEDALAVAIAHGDLAAQAVLAAAIGYQALLQGDPTDAQERFAAAKEAAEALAEPRIREEVGAYVAVSLTNQGRLREACAEFEELLGDIPRDLVSVRDTALLDLRHPVPGSVLTILAHTWLIAGQAPRAFDLLHRMIAAGIELGSSALEHQGRLVLALAHVGREEFAAARPYAEESFEFWRTVGAEPLYRWFSASALCSVRLAEGRTDEARQALAYGIVARRESGWPIVAAPAALRTLDRLEAAGGLPEGISTDDELDRLLRWPNLFLRGVASSLKAERLARGDVDEAVAARIDDLHRDAIACIAEAGGLPELVRALEAAATWSGSRGRADEAEARRKEARDAAAAIAGGFRSGGDATARLGTAILELGRLGSLGTRREGLLGEIAARLAGTLGAERTAIVEVVDGKGPALLGARGGGQAWLDEVCELVRTRAEHGAEFVDVPGGGSRLLLPLRAPGVGRHGWLVLENRTIAPAIGPADGALVEALGVQLSVLLENVALWQELVRARRRLEEENRYYRQTRPAPVARGRLVGDSPALRGVLELVERVAGAAVPVLVTGETGVGKELVAGELHRRGPRKDGPFIAVHVASMAPGLVASGLFGHERGAFTGATEQVRGRFELADGGTLFLDEVGELGAEDQVRLLRVLQEGTFERVGGTKPLRSDFRLVCATNRDLAAEVKAGRFREDLYFRINVFPIDVPPLRERREEIPTLALYFMERAARSLGVRFEGISEADMERLLEYGWPGNVRELEHLIERAAILSEPPRLRIPALAAGSPRDDEAEELVSMAEAERRHLLRVIRHTKGRITGAGGAAELLEMKPSTVNFRIGKLGLRDELAAARTGKS